MLPVINYHLNNLFSKIDGILDDDKSKVNKYFPNITKKIVSLKILIFLMLLLLLLL